MSGGYLGVSIGGGAGAVTNSGVITGTTHGGVAFGGGGTVTNQNGGTITGASFGVYIAGGSAAQNEVTNAGRISASGTNSIGVNLGSGGAVTNQSGGTISGAGFGVDFSGGSGSATNAGTITGGPPRLYSRGRGRTF
jgi:hypothetical protein